jgi:DNA-directed RNA polymerase subunit RPC12/RpoP
MSTIYRCDKCGSDYPNNPKELTKIDLEWTDQWDKILTIKTELCTSCMTRLRV